MCALEKIITESVCRSARAGDAVCVAGYQAFETVPSSGGDYEHGGSIC